MRHVLPWALLVLALPARAQEQAELGATGEEEELGVATEDEELGVSAEVERPMAAGGGEDPTASATEIDTRNRARALDTLEEAIVEAPGAIPRLTGAYGSPATLSLRGADAEHTEVLIGELPLATADGAAFDLASMPLFLLDRIEVYRGGAPAWLGAGGIGGVLRLLPRTPERTRLRASAGAGSFGLWRGAVGAEVEGPGARWATALGLGFARGDFPYADDARTPGDPSDDVARLRRNAESMNANGIATLGLDVAGGSLDALLIGRVTSAGVPGPAALPTRDVRRREVDLLASAGWSLRQERFRFAISAAGGVRSRRLRDRLGEIGLVPRDADDWLARGLLRVAASGFALEWLELTAVGLYTHEELMPSDALAAVPNASSSRDRGAVAAEARVFGRIGSVRLDLRGSARLELAGSRLNELRPERLGQASESFAVAPTFRLAGAIEPIAGLAIGAQLARATRLPSMTELFGDRGYLVGNASLRPEEATDLDASVVLRGRAGDLRGVVEARGFAIFASDLIRWARNAQYQVVAENVASATMVGLEGGVRGDWGEHISLRLAATWLSASDQSGRALPLRPSGTLYARPEFHIRNFGCERLTLYADARVVGESYADAAGSVVLGARAQVGVGASLEWPVGSIALSVRDVFDARGTDLLGFPLPGRSFAVELTLAP